MPAQPTVPLAEQALDEAADWLLRFSEGDVSADEHEQWQHWRGSSPERQQAWERAQVLLGKLGGLPPALAMSALDRPANPGRRAAVAKLAALLALLPGSFGAWKLLETQQWTADFRSAVGERRELQLADGSQITLNTDSAIDVRFDSQQRRVHLRQGEILVQTARDPGDRPFLVTTEAGWMQALGTRFTVREQAGSTRLVVLEGAVRVQLAEAGGAQQVINAGQRTTFSASQLAPPETANPAASAWTQGMLLADNLRLADFLVELARYRKGFVRCDPAIADLRISGAFPISDSQRTLDMLQQTYPLVIRQHWQGYWVMLSAA
ncbi:histidine kinase [Pseudomonas chlororaphis]|uniref:FecR domain-containing protein n=1 Tax=Pseudomonas morbosilactucae TaxID=2938197 RepID=A0A9X1Z1Z9_9PSED|nr:FecR domain-containing protein [Pseudomonas morbosilactucae]ROL70125.1 histidine kinase [Pseudomonas chlororaphis]WEK07655.1 MAG: FecR domain-containing protein [Pseudomonas sp.]